MQLSDELEIKNREIKALSSQLKKAGEAKETDVMSTKKELNEQLTAK